MQRGLYPFENVLRLVCLADDDLDACAQDVAHQRARLKHGQHHDAQVRVAAREELEQDDAVAVAAAGHGVVGDGEVAAHAAEHGEQFVGVAGLADHLETAGRRHEAAHGGHHARVIIGNDELNGMLHGGESPKARNTRQRVGRAAENR